MCHISHLLVYAGLESEGTGAMERDLIKISEMAGMHGISRQTLILYDRKGLLKPAYVNGSGYRFYSADQIPRLRLICLLKEMGVTLAKIKSFFDAPSPSGMLSLIDERKRAAEQKIEELELQVEELMQLSGIYEHLDAKLADAGLPHIEWLPRRRAAFAPYPDAEMDELKLHLSLMHAWDQVLDAGLLPSKGFGSLLQTAALRGDAPLQGAGSIVLLPRNDVAEELETIELPEGTYVTLYTSSMPYDPKPAGKVLAWMDEHRFVPDRQVVSCCLLDAAMRPEGRDADFCRLEIRIADGV